MAHFQCEKCGSTEFEMQDGVYVCQNCGAQYQMEEEKSAAESQPEQTPAEDNKMQQPSAEAEEGRMQQIPAEEMPLWDNSGFEVSDTDTNKTGSSRYDLARSPKSWLATLLLCIFLGPLGIHRFYVGKIGTGVIWLFTHGAVYVGWVTDFVMILIGMYTDKQGRLILRKHHWKMD